MLDIDLYQVIIVKSFYKYVTLETEICLSLSIADNIGMLIVLSIIASQSPPWAYHNYSSH